MEARLRTEKPLKSWTKTNLSSLIHVRYFVTVNRNSNVKTNIQRRQLLSCMVGACQLYKKLPKYVGRVTVVFYFYKQWMNHPAFPCLCLSLIISLFSHSIKGVLVNLYSSLLLNIFSCVYFPFIYPFCAMSTHALCLSYWVICYVILNF